VHSLQKNFSETTNKTSESLGIELEKLSKPCCKCNKDVEPHDLVERKNKVYCHTCYQEKKQKKAKFKSLMPYLSSSMPTMTTKTKPGTAKEDSPRGDIHSFFVSAKAKAKEGVQAAKNHMASFKKNSEDEDESSPTIPRHLSSKSKSSPDVITEAENGTTQFSSTKSSKFTEWQSKQQLTDIPAKPILESSSLKNAPDGSKQEPSKLEARPTEPRNYDKPMIPPKPKNLNVTLRNQTSKICQYCGHEKDEGICLSCNSIQQTPDEEQICAKCKRNLGSEGCKQFQGQNYHNNCFTCTVCNKPLVGNISLKATDPYHLECLIEDCAKCLKPLSGKVMNCNGTKFHRECFLCSSCTKPLQSRNFVIKEQKCYCRDCNLTQTI